MTQPQLPKKFRSARPAPKPLPRDKRDPAPDRAGLEKLGQSVRARLEQDPSAYRIPVEQAEIFAITDFLGAEECAQLMALVDQTARPSDTFDDKKIHNYRTYYSGDIDPLHPLARQVERRIDDLLGIDHKFGECLQGQRYALGQEYQAHCDYFAPLADFFQAEIGRAHV